MNLFTVLTLIGLVFRAMCYGENEVDERLTTSFPQNSKVDRLWTCSSTPQTCLSPQSARDQCQTDYDCPTGGRCCYTECAKRCTLPRPCAKVICQDGYSCQERETPCQYGPCQMEAVCVPDSEVLCAPLNCEFGECQPGYKRAIGSDGCETCECVKKKSCGPMYFIYCAYGMEEDADGCPIGRCKKAPYNPCDQVSCQSGHECRFVEAYCFMPPCKPRHVCVPRMLTPYDNSCALKDRTTLGTPVLQSDKSTELDCYLHPCPDATVCTKMGPVINRCCWQYTQKQVMAPPKKGQCPQMLMIDSTEKKVPCEIDAQCPGGQKCCYVKKKGTRFYGTCMRPIHEILEDDPEILCNKTGYFAYILQYYGFCP